LRLEEDEYRKKYRGFSTKEGKPTEAQREEERHKGTE